jgi:hypothetical protein
MPWFRLEDSFHSHPKVIKAGNEAAGLYVRCGAYAAQHLTNGFIPEHVALLYGSHALADALVRAGLWRRARGGWRMPDYLDYNPSREAVEKERRARAERQARWREKKRGRNHSETNETVSLSSQLTPGENSETPVDNSESAAQDGHGRRVTRRVTNGASNAAPARPAPKEAGAGRPRASGASGRAGPSGPAVRAVPEWCGECDEQTRLLDPDRPRRCPTCHPLREELA